MTPMRERVDSEIDDYLGRLDRALGDLPYSQRREIVDEVSEHIREARETAASDDEVSVRRVLARLGDPLEIAREAMDRLGVRPSPPRRTGAMEIGALILLPIGGVVLPFVGWVVGVVLLWASGAWRTRDKVIGTLLLPGGLLFPLYYGLIGTRHGTSCGGSYDPTTGVSTHWCSGPPAWQMPLEFAGFIIAVLIPIVTAIYLGSRLQSPHPRG